jgi:DNA processing protein
LNLDLTLAQWVALSLIPRLGSRTLANLLDRFGSLDAILSASDTELQTVPRIGPRLAAAIRAVDLARTQQEIAAWQADGISIRLRKDGPPYPTALATLPDAPPVLFLRGTLRPEDTQAVAIVGTRRPALASRKLAAALAGTLAASGWTVVSGLAEGIDTAAHEGALQAGGRTLAVLGCGVRAIYPPANAALAVRIIRQGAVLSETHPDAPPDSPALVARNRLISGLSRAIVIVEAGAAGGCLYAARYARAQARVVYAVDHRSPGNQRLIADGASPLPPESAAWEPFLADLANRC